MTDEEYKDMIMQHDKHIDKLAVSVEHIATAVGSTNRKLEDIIDVISKQNILMEKFSNLEINLKESFAMVHSREDKLEKRLDDIEDTVAGASCQGIVNAMSHIKALESNQSKVVWTILSIIISALIYGVINHK